MKKIVALGFIVISLWGTAVHAQEGTTSTKNVRAWLASTYDAMEVFREKNSEHYTVRKQELQKKLRIDKAATSPEKMKEGQEIEAVVQDFRDSTRLDNPLDYLQYICVSALATFFSESLIFYATVALLLLIMIRFLIGRVV